MMGKKGLEERSRGLGDVYKRQGRKALIQRAVKITAATSAVIVEEVQVVGG